MNQSKDDKKVLPKYVFLGGTCNNSTWRDELMPMLTERKISFFNPVVDDWTLEKQKEEEIAKQYAYFELYVLTPEMTGVYSIAEMVYSAFKRPTHTILCVPEDDRWDDKQRRSIDASIALAQKAGAEVHGGAAVAYCSTLKDVADHLKYAIYGDDRK